MCFLGIEIIVSEIYKWLICEISYGWCGTANVSKLLCKGTFINAHNFSVKLSDIELHVVRDFVTVESAILCKDILCKQYISWILPFIF
jgi:hypothetical protein